MLEEEKKEELLALLTGKKYRELKSQLVEMNEVDIASFIEELDSEKTVVVFRMLPKELASEVFACLEVEQQQHIITSITDNELRAIIDDLYVDDAVDMLEELPATIVRRVLQNSSPDTRKLINQFLNYPENSAGSVMTAEYVGLKKNMTVEQAFDYIRKYGVDKETIYTCYVMDEKRRLEGVVTVKDLLMNDYAALMGDIMDPHVIKAYTTEDQEKVVETFNEYNLLSLPVVDGEDRLVGIITVDDVMDVMEQEATEDFEKMAAMLPSEKPYLKTGVFQLARNRIPWLMILMLSSMVTGGILLKYEKFIIGYEKEGRRIMEILGKVLSEKTEAIYKDITEGLIYPIKIVKLDPENEEDCSRPVAMDTGKKEFIVKVDNTLEDSLFENALIRDIIYCQQMSNNAPVLSAKSKNDIDGFQVAMMISSIIMDIDVENKLRSYDMHIDDIDTMRLSDLYAFLKSGMADYNRELYNVFTGLQITLLYFTTSKRSNIEEIIETFYLSDKNAMDAIDKYVDIIDRYGVDDNRSMMRCMRKLAIACGMKGRLLLEYEGKVTEV